MKYSRHREVVSNGDFYYQDKPYHLTVSKEECTKQAKNYLKYSSRYRQALKDNLVAKGIMIPNQSAANVFKYYIKECTSIRYIMELWIEDVPIDMAVNKAISVMR